MPELVEVSNALSVSDMVSVAVAVSFESVSFFFFVGLVHPTISSSIPARNAIDQYFIVFSL